MGDTSGKTPAEDSVGTRRNNLLAAYGGINGGRFDSIAELAEAADAYEELRVKLGIVWHDGTTHMSKEGKRLGAAVAKYRENFK